MDDKCKTCGYEAEKGTECYACFVARLEREGNEIAAQHDLAVEEEAIDEELAEADEYDEEERDAHECDEETCRYRGCPFGC